MRVLVWLALFACDGRADAPEPDVKPMTPHVDVPFTDGPALTPTADLVTWFEGDGNGKLVRIPVVVTASVLGITAAHVGTVAGPAGADALLLKLDDTAMSVSLADRMRPHCKLDEPCAVWLEGVWGQTMAMPDFGPPPTGPAKHPFSVRWFVGPVAAGDPARVRVAAK